MLIDSEVALRALFSVREQRARDVKRFLLQNDLNKALVALGGEMALDEAERFIRQQLQLIQGEILLQTKRENERIGRRDLRRLNRAAAQS